MFSQCNIVGRCEDWAHKTICFLNSWCWSWLFCCSVSSEVGCNSHISVGYTESCSTLSEGLPTPNRFPLFCRWLDALFTFCLPSRRWTSTSWPFTVDMQRLRKCGSTVKSLPSHLCFTSRTFMLIDNLQLYFLPIPLIDDSWLILFYNVETVTYHVFVLCMVWVQLYSCFFLRQI